MEDLFFNNTVKMFKSLKKIVKNVSKHVFYLETWPKFVWFSLFHPVLVFSLDNSFFREKSLT